MENDILKKSVIECGLLYKPVIIPEILRECYSYYQQNKKDMSLGMYHLNNFHQHKLQSLKK